VVLYAVYRWRRFAFDGVLDGLVYAGMVGLGFAFTENILYYSRAALEGASRSP
jgi:RsiW-degrading membrane proteinase PrsW (M82 family)